MGILSREGADFGGYWRIILSYHFEGMRRSTLRLYNWRQNWAKKVSELRGQSKLTYFANEVSLLWK